MSSTIRVVLAVAVCVCMVTMLSEHAEGADNCQQVLTALQPCRNYLKQGGTIPAGCCKGVSTLNSAAKTTAMKRSFCECLKSQAKSLGVKSQFASNLPKLCNVNIGYPISYNTNCTSIQ